jgi:hypothetical protein
VLIKNQNGAYTVKPINQETISFEFMHITYRYSFKSDHQEADPLASPEVPHVYGFFPVVFNSNLPHSQMIQLYGQGLQSQEDVKIQRDLFGSSAIEIKKP